MSSDAVIIARYRVRRSSEEAERLARFIALEQTVELPDALVTDPYVRDRVVGQVRALVEVAPGVHLIELAFRSELASRQLPQLLNLVYGNVSMLPGVRLVDLELPESLLAVWSGPKYGIAGLRRLLGVHDRPLLATAIKPRGSSIEHLARLAHDFALGGGDLVKDDQNLVDPDFETFKRRVDAVAKAVAEANRRTGRTCLYFPHLAAREEDLERCAEFVYHSGLRGVLLCPSILGLDRAREIAARYGFVFMAHPAASGAYTDAAEHGIDHHLWLGTFLRLAGADISVYPQPGGRFAYPPERVRALTEALRGRLGTLKPCFPAPAGGMGFGDLARLSGEYGADAVFLIGGSLLGHSDDLVASTRTFQAEIARHFTPRYSAPEDAVVAVQAPSQEAGEGVRSVLSFLAGFHWQGRSDRGYKNGNDGDFCGVRRVELIGKSGELTDFDLRYFEVQPGGYTSREKHLHTHVIVIARGQGELVLGEDAQPMRPMDIAYIKPLEVHQLRNTGQEPFGFFCIVDRERDRPMQP